MPVSGLLVYLEAKANATTNAGSFDKLRTGSSTTLRYAQDDTSIFGMSLYADGC
jgi:hypothetical protein